MQPLQLALCDLYRPLVYWTADGSWLAKLEDVCVWYSSFK